MASNNYAQQITDSPEAKRVQAELESMAAKGSNFKVMQFNPDVDRFEVACWRESNFPTLVDVEACGNTTDAATAAALWKANAETLRSIDYGNGFIGLYYESEGRSYIAIPQPEPHAFGSRQYQKSEGRKANRMNNCEYLYDFDCEKCDESGFGCNTHRNPFCDEHATSNPEGRSLCEQHYSKKPSEGSRWRVPRP
ncbi:MAG TPA: hypothetical protein VMS18_18130 [Candidatus Binatia bacterium]|nr:hypothetical protein [Candidatus Binatia bacterium]